MKRTHAARFELSLPSAIVVVLLLLGLAPASSAKAQSPENQETGNPETGNPETEDPETGNPETEDPETEDPETENQETENQETENPEAEDPETENEQSSPDPDEGDVRKVLQLSLENAIELALARNFTVRQAALTERIAGRDLVIERAIFDPFFTLGGTFNKNRRPTASFLDIGGGALVPQVQVNPFVSTNYSGGFNGRTVLGTTYNLSLNSSRFDRPLATGLFGLNPQESTTVRATFNQPLLRGAWYPFNSAQLKIAANNQRLAREDRELAISDLIYEIEAAYWNLVFATEDFEAKASALKVAQEDLSKAIKEETAGTKAKIYVTTVRAQLRLREIDHNDTRLLLESARDRLLQVLNHGGDSLRERWRTDNDIGPYDDIRVVPTTKATPELFAPERGVSLAMAFENRADYRRFAIEHENQQLQADVAENALLPRVDLTTTWEQFGLADSVERSFSSLGSGQFYGWSVGLQIEMPLSNRGPKAAFRKAQDQLRRLSWQRIDLENQMVIEIDQSIRRLGSIWRKIELLEDVVRLKAEELDAERKKLDAGTSIPFAVHTIENDLIAQQASVLQARADYLTARAEYYKLTGVLLERYSVTIED